MNFLNKLDTPLLQLSKKRGDVWTIGDAVKGTFIVGSIGSGKSSGSGRTLAHAFLRAGFGGLVLCAKPDEADTWRQYATETGRENSLIVMDGKAQKRFNFIDYELNRIDKGSYTTPLALDAFMKIYEAMKLLDGGGGGNDRFWSDSVKLLLSHSIDALFFALGEVRFSDLMNFIRETPTSRSELQNPAFLNSLHYKIMDAASSAVDESQDPDKIAIMEAVADWFWGFYEMDKKTRSNIIATLESMALDFTKGDLAKIFCTTTNIVPEMSHHGAVIVLDFPLKVWQRGGILAQHIFKYSWMRAIERRQQSKTARPCFLWGDEYQLFISSYDNEFSSTARSSKACTVYLTQSIPALRDAAKTPAAKDTVDTLLNNFQTRIIHSCLDDTTRVWAADTIGKSLQWRYSEQHNINENTGGGTTTGSSAGNNDGINTHMHSGGGFTASGSGGGRTRGKNRSHNTGNSTNQSVGNSEGTSRQQVIDYHLQPAFFGSSLRMGGEQNNFMVDGVFLVGGKVWEYTQKPFLITSFSQKAL